MTTKQELVGSAESDPDGWSHHHTYATHQYSRIHRTSGTKGSPLLIADTAEDWKWWSNTWQHVLAAANVTTEDRVFLAFSFGPFIGFWSAHQACTDRGAMVIPAGGLSSLARLQFLRQTQATVVCCTPIYALHLAEVARSEDFPLTDLPVDRLIVAGESGGSLPEMRSAIENAWKARVIDHAGATEIGPWGFGWPEGCGLHVIESSFIAEIIPLRENIAKTSRDQPASQPPGAARCSTNQDSLAKDSVGELVLTSLGRFGAPVIRYRTGDVVRATERLQSNTVCNFLWLPNGIIGRTDDMLTVRGVNIFPSSVDSLVRQVAPTAEYLVQVNRDRSMQELLLNIECDSATAGSLQKAPGFTTGPKSQRSMRAQWFVATQ